MAQPKRALIVIDVQNEYVSGDLLIEYPPVDQSLANIGRAMDAATAAGIPVVLVQHLAPEDSPIFARGSRGAELHPLVADRAHDLQVRKTLPSALTGTDLGPWLRERGIDTLTIVGYMTQHCDESTARQARHEGWNVELLHDATGSVPFANDLGSASAEEIHRVFTLVSHTGFAAVASTEQWLAAVATGEALQPDNLYLSNQRAVKARG
ncbi:MULTISPECIES: cysteine hydrolase family protein [unclassified Pseudomonas]|uniref:cysteine hydrolase family protein n=1 Tax=unclassified Pseudomonas TaxID=196821 RepID=UPI000DA96AC9|nr:MULTISPECIES: cysteine hydrolase family protein [unclassified Pseudomonas]MDW3712115.1 cysteine hydrolase family protein [Pseudomonas sp. 2023EL-01195]PZE10753.1 cysteine hydrolase [Pseudomonas sp. 57B-090624]